MPLAVASSSSSSSRTDEAKRYHLFLNFRGEDTRNTFVSHLRSHLRREKIETFFDDDDDDLHRGEEISSALLNAIEESKIAIVVFSKGYASSTWCLEELAKINECKKSRDLIVVPVFYHVDPVIVRKQTGMFAEAFVKHKERFGQSSEKVQRWRTALTETANTCGFHLDETMSEAEVVETIVKNILKKLEHMSSSANVGLVGIESSIKKVESLLRIGSKDVIRVGIWGMGGLGKTALADAVYSKIKRQFEKVHFQYDVREQIEKYGSVTQLKAALCLALLGVEDACQVSTFMKDRLQKTKVLLVLDDVMCWEKVETLIEVFDYFGPESRIIITTRDRQVLRNCGVDDSNIYEIKPLADHDGRKLFECHAFKSNQCTQDYKVLSEKALLFAKGVPLALKVLGGSLYGKKISEWKSALSILETNSNCLEIQNVLKIVMMD